MFTECVIYQVCNLLEPKFMDSYFYVNPLIFMKNKDKYWHIQFDKSKLYSMMPDICVNIRLDSMRNLYTFVELEYIFYKKMSCFCLFTFTTNTGDGLLYSMVIHYLLPLTKNMSSRFSRQFLKNVPSVLHA